MLGGWYCRSLANQDATDKPEHDRDQQESDEDEKPRVVEAASSTEPGTGVTDYKERYKNLKRKLKFLIYENEYFQDLMRTNQRRLLKVSRDRAFLLDRLLLYEKPAKDSSDSDATDSSDDLEPNASGSTSAPNMQSQLPLGMPKEGVRKRKSEGKIGAPITNAATVSGATRGRKRKINTLMSGQQPSLKKQAASATVSPLLQQPAAKDETLSTAEIARQLQERIGTELMSPECTSATVPATMLSDDSPSKCYNNESLQQLMEDDSHVAAEECVPMEYTN